MQVAVTIRCVLVWQREELPAALSRAATGHIIFVATRDWEHVHRLWSRTVGIENHIAAGFAGALWGIKSLENFDEFGVDAYINHLRHRRSHRVSSPSQALKESSDIRSMLSPSVPLWAAPVLAMDRLPVHVLFER